MRRWVPLLALLLASSVVADEVSWANKFFVKPGAAVPKTIVHDFGTVAKGTVKTYRFPMTNIYEVPLNLGKPEPSCGCVTVLAYSGKLEPLETGYIEIKIDTSRVEGKKVVFIPVTFENRVPGGQYYSSTATLEVRTESRADIQMLPGAVDFGVVAAGQAVTKTLNLSYYGRMPGWQITQKGFKKEVLDVDIKANIVRGVTTYAITATLKDTAPSGVLAEEIILQTNDPAAPTLTIAVNGKVEAPFSLVPGDVVRFDKPIPVGMQAEKNIIVRSADKAFSIKKVDGQEKGVAVQLIPVPASKTQVIPVTFAPKQAGMVKQELLVTLDTGDTIKLTVLAVGINKE